MTTAKRPVLPPADGACATIPELKRLTYFYGQMLGPHDLQGESAYVREKLRLANRYLHGWGVVCGLDVEPAPPDEDCVTKEQDQQHRRAGIWLVKVLPGVGFDCRGDQVVLRDEVEVDLWCALSAADRERVEAGHGTVFVSACYHERPVEPARPVVAHACGVPDDCAYARVLETATVRVTVDRPAAGEACEACCDGCPDPCLVLAEVSGLQPGEPVQAAMVDQGVRRMITRHALTTVAGISWVHGATYPLELADQLLQDGFQVRFSRPVRVDTLTPGVVELLVFEGAPGRAGGVYHKSGEYVGLPAAELTDRFVYRQEGGEGLQSADRVLIKVRADFILDQCCRAVDGNHLGGRVPLLAGYEERYGADRPTVCLTPPSHRGAWTSGNGSEGGVFESWFFVERREQDYERQRRIR